MVFSDLEQIRACTRPSDWWTKYFLHPVSIRLVSLVRDSRITPNHLTLMSTAVAFAACSLICFGSHSSMIAAAVLLHISLVFDCADGQLARYKHYESKVGDWLDRCTDKIKDFAIIYAFTFRLSQINPNAWMFGFCCFFILFFIDFLGFMNRLSPLLPACEQAMVEKKEAGLIRRLKIFKQRINYRLFQIGEQYIAYTVFIIFNRIDLLFYFMIAYGSLTIGWIIFNLFRETRLLNREEK
ncbi:MAG: CDP-alcohol phosphatidyltransferase family protein [Planctomycetota bacterium]|jgi:phosphatidylglycerophosphate synthase